ncbi:MAG: hypothetical protein CLLPBCKN_006555 [Chroococcidiopsis cubana SAG 39.79]|nr:hypothetical protein [Chroococcidiopsis cubana SAG 39.79]
MIQWPAVAAAQQPQCTLTVEGVSVEHSRLSSAGGWER